MRRDGLRKLSASLLVLVMALSALAVLPVSIRGATPGTEDIYVPVVGDDLQPVPDATVTLTNVHTGETVNALHSSGVYFVAEGAPSGYYRVDVTSTNHYDSLGEVTFPFDGLESYISESVVLEKFRPKTLTWNVTLTPAIGGAEVGFYDNDKKEIVSKATTGSLGFAVVSMFNTTTIPRDFYLYVKATGYDTHVELVSPISGSQSSWPVTLIASKQVLGLVYVGSTLAKNVVAYAVDTNDTVPWIKRVLKSGPTMGSFSFDADPSVDYILCVEANGASARIMNLPSTQPMPIQVVLEPQVQRLEEIRIVFGDDYTTFSMNMSTTWTYDTTFPGLLYSDIGSLRMQLDLNSNCDGYLDSTEATQFMIDMMSEYGPEFITTLSLLVVNETLTEDGRVYTADGSLSDFMLDLSEGPVTSMGAIEYYYACDYTVYTPSGEEELPVDSPSYKLDLYAKNDNSRVNYTYSIALMDGYELVSNSTTDEDVFVGGYLTVIVDPGAGDGVTEKVEMYIEEFSRPIAGAGIDDSPTVYAVTDEGGNVTRYIVKVGANVSLTANDSEDPNGNPLEFTWVFGDGSAPLTTMTPNTTHVYTSAGEVTVNLTVVDESVLSNWTEIDVVCDAVDPVPVLTVKDLVVNETDNSIRVNESEVFWLNATSSHDGAAADGDGLGIIDFVEFEYGDGNTSGRVYWDDPQQNVSHSYENAGSYNLTLNVTDVVGHWKNTTLTVYVNDTSPPTPTFSVKNETWGATLIENKTLTFDANGTRDNVDNYTLMTYHWNFGDDTAWDDTTGYNTTHVYQKIGRFLVTLNVTDLSGNNGTYSKWVTISSSPRADVSIDNMWFEPEVFTEGKGDQYVWVNLTNKGSAVATEVMLTFYIVDDTDKVIGTTTVLWNGTSQVSSIGVGGKAQVKFAWSPDAKGTYTIKVTVTSTNQLITHSQTEVVDVNEAGWKKYALWGGVLGVLVLVPLLLYFRGRWTRREKKGPRRERKSEQS